MVTEPIISPAEDIKLSAPELPKTAVLVFPSIIPVLIIVELPKCCSMPLCVPLKRIAAAFSVIILPSLIIVACFPVFNQIALVLPFNMASFPKFLIS